LTAASISFAGVSWDNVTIETACFLSEFPELLEGVILTFSTVRLSGIKALIVAGEVPGGIFDSRSVGFAIAFSSALSVAPSISSSSLVLKALAAGIGPPPLAPSS
jgi:hypothetical protein